MGHTTKIPDAEWERGDGPKEVPEGYDPEEELKVKSKVIEPEDKPEPEVSSVAKTKDVPAE